MADSVRCVADSAHAFTCDVHIDSEVEPTSASSAKADRAPTPPVTPARPQNPAVSSLVDRVTKVTLPTTDVPYVTGRALLNCAGNEASVALAAVAGKPGPLATLAMLKFSFDTGKCLALEHNAEVAAADQRESADDCEARGGTVTSVVSDTTFCEVPVSK